jgi:NAD(P)-dependent dehydrogenase (short-subunit alcohol dehydrogenase family)
VAEFFVHPLAGFHALIHSADNPEEDAGAGDQWICVKRSRPCKQRTFRCTEQSERETDMSSPVVLITGALTGIGRATAFAYAREGARVVVSGRNEETGAELVRELNAAGAEAEFVRADVRHEEDVKNLVGKTVARFGRLDIAVNNAGTEGIMGLAADATVENYQAIFETNVLGVILSMKHEIRAMLPQGKGSIVNISSAYGKIGGPGAGIYVGSKHAVEGITKSAALELAGTGVRVNVVGPGPIETAMFNRFAQTKENKAAFVEAQVPNKRMGNPEEIADAIVFLGSDRASYIIGASLAVDGGMIAG